MIHLEVIFYDNDKHQIASGQGTKDTERHTQMESVKATNPCIPHCTTRGWLHSISPSLSPPQLCWLCWGTTKIFGNTRPKATPSLSGGAWHQILSPHPVECQWVQTPPWSSLNCKRKSRAAVQEPLYLGRYTGHLVAQGEQFTFQIKSLASGNTWHAELEVPVKVPAACLCKLFTLFKFSLTSLTMWTGSLEAWPSYPQSLLFLTNKLSERGCPRRPREW